MRHSISDITSLVGINAQLVLGSFISHGKASVVANVKNVTESCQNNQQPIPIGIGPCDSVHILKSKPEIVAQSAKAIFVVGKVLVKVLRVVSPLLQNSPPTSEHGHFTVDCHWHLTRWVDGVGTIGGLWV